MQLNSSDGRATGNRREEWFSYLKLILLCRTCLNVASTHVLGHKKKMLFALRGRRKKEDPGMSSGWGELPDQGDHERKFRLQWLPEKWLTCRCVRVVVEKERGTWRFTARFLACWIGGV